MSEIFPVQYMNVKLDELIPGCANFRWYEVLYLHEWDTYCYPTYEQVQNLQSICWRAEIVRKILNSPLSVVSGLRPAAYNDWIGGRIASAHLDGFALDLKSERMSADSVRAKLVPKLAELDIRLENLPGTLWFHIDGRDPGDGQRFFVP